MLSPGRGVADRAPYPRLVADNPPMPAFVLDPPRPLRGAPLVLAWAGMVAGGWCFVAGLAWTAYAVCRVTGMCR